MTDETAIILKLCLIVGLETLYDECFDLCLTEEDPLSELTLALTDCRNDKARFDCLARYTENCPSVDICAIERRLIRHLKEEYRGGRLPLERLLKMICQIAYLLDYPSSIGYICALADYYDIAKEGIWYTMEQWETEFEAWLAQEDGEKLYEA